MVEEFKSQMQTVKSRLSIFNKNDVLEKLAIFQTAKKVSKVIEV
jgi:hypothetical protein